MEEIKTKLMFSLASWYSSLEYPARTDLMNYGYPGEHGLSNYYTWLEKDIIYIYD